MKMTLAPNSSRAASFEVACLRPFIDAEGQLCYGFNSPFGLSSASLQLHLEGVLEDLYSHGCIDSWATGCFTDCPRGLWLWLNDPRDVQFD